MSTYGLDETTRTLREHMRAFIDGEVIPAEPDLAAGRHVLGNRHVEAARGYRQREPQVVSAGAAVEHHEGPVGGSNLHARGVAAVAQGGVPRLRDRPAGSPEANAHRSTPSVARFRPQSTPAQPTAP